MSSFISHIHLFLLRLVTGLITLWVALTVSLTVQRASSDLSFLTTGDFPFVFGTTLLLWALFCMPVMRVDAIVAPREPSHMLAQLGLGTFGAAAVLMTALHPMNAPLIMWLSPFYMAPLLALFCAICVVLLAVFGMIRALTAAAAQDRLLFQKRLRIGHRRAAQLAALSAAVISVVILASVLIAGRPTTQVTMVYTLFLLGSAALLAWPRFELAYLKRPDRLWHIVPILLLVGGALHAIERITRAFGFHSQLFESFAVIDTTYPALENLFMLPFIIFGMIGIALALRPIDEAQEKPSNAQVFG